jgi:cob(I)alamin adenosyltransferase
MTIRITRVYTRSGDDGTTGLIGGGRVPKDHPRVEAYGCLDELNSWVGVCRTALGAEKSLSKKALADFDQSLREIQNRLFDLGSVFAAPEGKTWEGMPVPGQAEITTLEKSMDAMQKSLKPLNSFVLPGGAWPNAWLHVCRAQCRRAERLAVGLAKREKVPPEALRYLNRLADWFFVAARFAAKGAKKKEYLWEYGLKPKPKR